MSSNNDLVQLGMVAFRHEGFVHGFVAARDPKTPRDTLLALEEAERAWLLHIEQMKEVPSE